MAIPPTTFSPNEMYLELSSSVLDTYGSILLQFQPASLDSISFAVFLLYIAFTI